MLIPTKDIDVHPENRRKITSHDRKVAIPALADSMKKHGQLHAIVVAKQPPRKGRQPRYWVVAGQRRVEAMKLTGAEKIEATQVLSSDTKSDLAALSLSENEHRRPLTPFEEAAYLQRLLKDNTREETAAKIGRSPGWVARRAVITNLSELWSDAIAAAAPTGVIASFGISHLILIARMPVAFQNGLLDEMQGYHQDAPTLRNLQERCALYACQLYAAPWALDPDVVTLVPGRPACAKCGDSTAAQRDLFEDFTNVKGDYEIRCLNEPCFNMKMRAWITRRVDAFVADGQKPVVIVSWDNKIDFTKTNATIAEQQDVEICKKSAEGARPLIFCDDPKRPRWGIVRADAVDPDGMKGGAGEAGADAPTPLAEKRAKKQRQRDTRVCVELANALVGTKKKAGATCRLTDNQLLAAAIAFGTNNIGHSEHPCMQGVWSKYRDLEKSKDKPRQAAIDWFRQFAAKRLSLGARDRDPHVRSEAKRFAAFFDVDLQAIREKVAKQMPDPASWAKLEADGTPKKTAKKPAKKKAKK